METPADLREALAACEAAREAAERTLQQQATRYELLLNLASLPDLSLEAAPVVAATPPDPAAPGAAPHGWHADVREETLRASLQHVVEVICRGFGADTTALFFTSHGGREIRVRGYPHHVAPSSPSGTGGTEGGAAISAPPGCDLTNEHWFDDPHFQRVLRRCEGVRWTSGEAALMAVPLVMEGDVRGALLVARGRPDTFTEPELSFLSLVAARLGLLLERAELAQAQREVDRQRAQAAARQELLGIVTHELKTPVAVLRAYTEVLLGRAQQAGRTDEMELLERIDDQAERLLGMVEQVLDLQRLDAGLFPLEIGRVDLGALARSIIADLQVASPGMRLELHCGAAEKDGSVQVRADRRRIEQALTNLIQNAIRFSPSDGEVRVWVRRDGERALVSVSDQGPGVSEEDRTRIFARFYQGKGGAALHRGHGGLGVGLYIAREIVSRHGGELWLERPVQGSGATFTFELPVTGPEEAREPIGLTSQR